LAVDDI